MPMNEARWLCPSRVRMAYEESVSPSLAGRRGGDLRHLGDSMASLGGPSIELLGIGSFTSLHVVGDRDVLAGDRDVLAGDLGD